MAHGWRSDGLARWRGVLVTIGLLATPAAGCGDDEPLPPDPPYDPSICEDDERGDTYAAGLEKAGEKGALRVRLDESSPAPPDKGENSWTIQVLDAGGAPVQGATISATALMPDHGHGSAATPVVKPAGSDGRYTIAPIDLAMAGLWTVTLTLSAPSGESDTVKFSFCVEG